MDWMNNQLSTFGRLAASSSRRLICFFFLTLGVNEAWFCPHHGEVLNDGTYSNSEDYGNDYQKKIIKKTVLENL